MNILLNNNEIILDGNNIEMIPNINIGDKFQGGIVFWTGLTEGLIFAEDEHGSGITWGCSGTLIGCPQVPFFVPGLGKTYTDLIVSTCTGVTPASICVGLNISGYTDWYLPEQRELQEMYLQKEYGTFISRFTYDRYMSSTEVDDTLYWRKSFYFATDSFGQKDLTNYYTYIRPIRHYTL